MNTKLRRSVAALATAFACLVLMASPASATTHTAAITGGNITLVNSAGTTSLNIPWAGSAGANCGHTFAIDETAGAYDVTAYSSRSRHPFLFSSFIAVVTRTGSTPGTITGGTTLDASATLSLRIEFYNIANANPATDCNTTGTLRCGYNVTLHLGGGVTGWTVSSTGTLSYPAANLALSPPVCAAPYSTWINGTVAAGGVSFHITS